MSCFNSFDNLCRRIVCPTRHALNESQMIQRKFKGKATFEHIEVINKDNQSLSVLVFPKDFVNLPTVLYLHGNGGHKMESLQIVHGAFNVVSFDFRGCGKSEGNYITYGDQEVRDICCVVEQIKIRYKINRIALWGRSMGASLAIMYASLCPQDIFCMILDSPFRKLKKVVVNVAQQTKTPLPNFIINLAVYLVQKKVEQIVDLNVFETDFLMHLNLLNDIPILFAYSSSDLVVREQDVKQLYGAYRGRKKVVQIQSLHHQDRPKFFIQQGIEFVIDQNQSKTSRITFSSKKGLSLSTRMIN